MGFERIAHSSSVTALDADDDLLASSRAAIGDGLLELLVQFLAGPFLAPDSFARREHNRDCHDGMTDEAIRNHARDRARLRPILLALILAMAKLRQAWTLGLLCGDKLTIAADGIFAILNTPRLKNLRSVGKHGDLLGFQRFWPRVPFRRTGCQYGTERTWRWKGGNEKETVRTRVLGAGPESAVA
jgi:hypothetical protein